MGHRPADTGRGHRPGGLECRQGDRTATTTSERTTSSNTGGMDRRRAERDAATDRPSGTAAHEPCPRRCHRARDPGAAGAGTPAYEKHRRRCLLGLRCSRQRIRTELQDGRGRLGAVQTVGRGRDTAAGSGMAWPVLTNPQLRRVPVRLPTATLGTMSNLFLTRREVESVVGLSKTSVYRLMRLGKFPAPIRVGQRAVRWNADEIAAWLSDRPRSHGDRAADQGRIAKRPVPGPWRASRGGAVEVSTEGG